MQYANNNITNFVQFSIVRKNLLTNDDKNLKSTTKLYSESTDLVNISSKNSHI